MREATDDREKDDYKPDGRYPALWLNTFTMAKNKKSATAIEAMGEISPSP